MDDKIWISIIGLALSITTFLIGRASANKAEGEKNGYLASDIGYIKAGIDDLKTEIRTLKIEIADLSERLVRVEEQVKNHQNRIEILEKG